jgi:hypothetical protein
MDAQRTIRRQISCVGIGLHSGNRVNLTLRPAPADFGIRFRRTDLGDHEVPATVHNLAGINMATGLARWASGFVLAYDRAKARAGSLDFLDLLLRARNLVRDRPDVRRDFQQGIRYLLVDEFQDTDPLQLEMVLSLAEGAPPGSLFVVGDPKQSIYRFRRADIETYEDAKRTIAGRGEVLTIRANFRSSRAILDAVNGVFEGVMVPPPDGAYQPAYVALEPSPRTQPGGPPAVLALPPDLPAAGSVSEAAAQEARLVAAYLLREVEHARRFRYGDVALLFRAMTNVVSYEDALREAGIPFRTIGAATTTTGPRWAGRSRRWRRSRTRTTPVALVALSAPVLGVTDEMPRAPHLGRRVLLSPAAPGGCRPVARAGMTPSACCTASGTPWRRPRSSSGSWPAPRPSPPRLEPQGEARVANL